MPFYGILSILFTSVNWYIEFMADYVLIKITEKQYLHVKEFLNMKCASRLRKFANF